MKSAIQKLFPFLHSYLDGIKDKFLSHIFYQYRNLGHISVKKKKKKSVWFSGRGPGWSHWPTIPFRVASTVETPYNTAPYITGSNIARLGHGSQNS